MGLEWEEKKRIRSGKENIFNFDSDPDVRRIQRARQKMPEEDRAFMMQMLKRSFGEYFEDDSSDDPDWNSWKKEEVKSNKL